MTAIFHHKICQIVPEIISKPDRYPPMEHLSNDHENHPNQLKNSQKLCNEMWHLVQSLMESQWKLREKNDQYFPMDGKPL